MPVFTQPWVDHWSQASPAWRLLGSACSHCPCQWALPGELGTASPAKGRELGRRAATVHGELLQLTVQIQTLPGAEDEPGGLGSPLSHSQLPSSAAQLAFSSHLPITARPDNPQTGVSLTGAAGLPPRAASVLLTPAASRWSLGWEGRKRDSAWRTLGLGRSPQLCWLPPPPPQSLAQLLRLPRVWALARLRAPPRCSSPGLHSLGGDPQRLQGLVSRPQARAEHKFRPAGRGRGLPAVGGACGQGRGRGQPDASPLRVPGWRRVPCARSPRPRRCRRPGPTQTRGR